MQTADNPIESSVDRDQGSLTNLWELIQAAKDEDRQRTHDNSEAHQEPTHFKEGIYSDCGDGPFTPARRTH